MRILFLFVLYGISIHCHPARPSLQPASAPLQVIFETDMGNDVDDALALDMLYKYMDEGKIKLLAVSSNKNSIYSPLYLSLMNSWYGYPNIPVGTVANGANSEGDAINYAEVACKSFKTPDTAGKWKGSVALYRQLLSALPDHSVTIVTVGFSTNLAQLLASAPDQYSPLHGKALVARKVTLLSMMAGSFDGKKMAEYNVKKDVPAAEKVFREWPGTMVASPFELGAAIKYPATSIQNDFKWTTQHPVVVAYESYQKMPYDRPTWDLTSVLYAVEGQGSYFSVSEPGTITVDKEGHTFFTPSANGKHFYLTANDQQKDTIKKRFISLVTRQPKH